jgi:hypothetical protein
MDPRSEKRQTAVKSLVELESDPRPVLTTNTGHSDVMLRVAGACCGRDHLPAHSSADLRLQRQINMPEM